MLAGNASPFCLLLIYKGLYLLRIHVPNEPICKGVQSVSDIPNYVHHNIVSEFPKWCIAIISRLIKQNGLTSDKYYGLSI